MVNRYSISAKKRWAEVPKDERSRRMRKLALIKHKKMSPIEKKKQMDKMNKARNGH